MKLFFSMINPVVGWLLASRLHFLISFQLLLLEVVGRRTGKIYKIPVSYASVEHTYCSGRLKVAPPKIAAQG